MEASSRPRIKSTPWGSYHSSKFHMHHRSIHTEFLQIHEILSTQQGLEKHSDCVFYGAVWILQNLFLGTWDFVEISATQHILGCSGVCFMYTFLKLISLVLIDSRGSSCLHLWIWIPIRNTRRGCELFTSSLLQDTFWLGQETSWSQHYHAYLLSTVDCSEPTTSRPLSALI